MRTWRAWSYPALFAHRGGGTLAPENTLAGLEAAFQHRYTAVEFDVKLSRDNVIFLMHDDSLNRTTNGVGLFKDLDAIDIEQLDAGSWMASFHWEGAPAVARVPRLSAAMAFLHAHGMNANIEIKPCNGREAETGHAVALLINEITRTHPLKPLLSSFSVEALLAARKSAPNLPIGLLVEGYKPADDATLNDLNCVSLHAKACHITQEMVSQLHQRDTRVMAYTVNDPSQAKALFALGVDGIFTDRLDAMASAFPKGLAAH